MKIESSAVLLSSQHSAVEQTVTHESLRSWTGNRRPDFENPNRNTVAEMVDRVTLSEQAKAAYAAESVDGTKSDEETSVEPRMMLLVRMIEAITGHKIDLSAIREFQASVEETEVVAQQQAATSQRAGFSVEYDYHRSYYEMESTQFSAQGIIRTMDGAEISFDFQLEMKREYTEETTVNVRLGDAVQKKDPLVINFNGTAAQLTDTRFSFDIDADGSDDKVSFLTGGSGFLALDRNNDGKIYNGAELFGPVSGEGFQELAAYDEDGNLWIDENDAVYTQLRLFNRNAEGNDVLTTLRQANVGAIYLGNVSTPFDIKNNQQVLNGQVRTSGVYLTETGTVGSVQQIDLIA